MSAHAVAPLAPLRSLLHLWRRSIQARVVIGTLTLSTVLALLAGWVMLRQITDGVLDSKREAALSQAAAGFAAAQSRLDSAPDIDPLDVGAVLNPLLDLLAPRSEAVDDYGIVALGPASLTGSAAEGGLLEAGLQFDAEASIPQDLLEKVRSTEGSWRAYTSLHPANPDLPTQPALVVGSQIRVPPSVDQTTGRTYALFYMFPLQEQRDTLSVVRSALITTGAVLVLLLGTIAWLVTRQVVTPVRLARSIAERLASGRLEERMHVRGEDDIARLGLSFNQMASSLQSQIRQLEELSRLQRRFVADVSHELRTPLTTVRMAADVLHDARQNFDAATARSAELLQAELDRFELLLSDLLEISRFDAGAAHLDLGDVDVREVVSRVIEASSALAADRGSELTAILPATPCSVEADARRLDRILRNLVVNAINYGEGRGVEIQVASTVEAVAVTVRDNGVGLKPGEATMVFNRFWRADPARARSRGGTGLGLSIAIEDTSLHGGKLEAWGRPGVGSVFRVVLPRRAGGEWGQPPLPLKPLGVDNVAAVGAPYARFSGSSRAR
ncbi:MAG: HAMP domain-containing histidine kinase [Nocardioidaceae bacterium]|nr:HAMP domain-containing histidine kinase [Nocardioidaceae bacterium]